MAFQFLCPQGHLLQADAAQMGRTINCPTCGVLFIVPTIAAPGGVQAVVPVPPAAPPAAPPPAPEEEQGELANLDFRKRPSRRFAHLEAELPGESTPAEQPFPDVAADTTAAFDPADSGPRLVHIDCPNGHELITPMDTMGDEVLCPHCGEQFTLRYEETREYKQDRYWKEEVEQQKLGKNWLTWAVVVGVLVVIMLGGMIIYSLQK
jgi:hypothetical protein